MTVLFVFDLLTEASHILLCSFQKLEVKSGKKEKHLTLNQNTAFIMLILSLAFFIEVVTYILCDLTLCVKEKCPEISCALLFL